VGDETTRPKEQAPAGLASRKLAVEILIAIEAEGAYANLAIASAFKRKTLSERDRAFVTALVQGVVRQRLKIDDHLSRISNQPLAKMPAFLRNALRLALFQLEQMPDIREAAVVDTCARLVRAAGHEGQVRFVNGVLRNYLRRRSTFQDEEVVPLNVEQLHTSYSMPIWLVERWLKNWGPDETKLLLEQAQQIPDLVVRACGLAITTDGLVSLLESRGVRVRRGQLVDSCLIVEDRGPCKGPPTRLPGYAEGLFSIQDEAAAFVSLVVDPKPGELVVDLCAAPGGKSLHMAELMENKGRIIAVDDHSSRLQLLRRARQRLGVTNVEVFVADGREFVLETRADRVLVDAPCTGTGVISRRSDIRFRREPPDLVQLTELQRQLLDHAAALVKPGGVLVYSTCSIEPEENEENIEWFLSRHSQFSPATLRPFVPDGLLAAWSEKGFTSGQDLESGRLTLLPSRHGTSGFFICRLLCGGQGV